MIDQPPNSTLTYPHVPHTLLSLSRVLQFAAHVVDLVIGKRLRLAAQQRLRQFHGAIAGSLEPRDLAALRLPQPAHFAVAAFLDRHLEPFIGIGAADALDLVELRRRSEEHTSELQSLMRNSYAVFCLTQKILNTH